MSGTLVPERTALAAEARRLWPELQPAAALGFVLYGEAALALHLGHRPAAGFDFHRARRLDAAALRAACAFLARAGVLEDGGDTLAVSVPGRGRAVVTVTFRGGIGSGRIGEPLITGDGVAQVASLDDLMAHKLTLLLKRPGKAHYEDVAAMIRAGCSLSRGLAGARTLFGRAFQPAAVVKALIEPAGAQAAALSRADRRTLASAARVVGVLRPVKVRSRVLALPRDPDA